MMRNALLTAACLCILAATASRAQQRSPSAHCNDGTYYYGTSRREACAHHRGVSEWLGSVSQSQLRSTTPRVRPQARKPTARRSRPPRTTTRARPAHPRPAGATARCKDGTWSKDPRRAGACARHGGIASWLSRR
jgi:hypothetical protein